MKAILLSIRPEHAYNILNGDKTLELRKSVPKDFVGWVYGYITKAKPLLVRMFGRYTLSDRRIEDLGDFTLNSNIIFRFWFDEYGEVEENSLYDVDVTFDKHGNQKYKTLNKLHGTYHNKKEYCISNEDLENYGKGKTLYAWHIKNLEIFDKPMELSEFKTLDISQYQDVEGNLSFDDYFEVKRAPQSWQYVWVNDL